MLWIWNQTFEISGGVVDFTFAYFYVDIFILFLAISDIEMV